MAGDVLATADACGKIILLGEHAVVYRQPAIAVPFYAVKATATVVANSPGSGFRVYLPTAHREFRFMRPDQGIENGLVATSRLTFDRLTPGQIEHDLTVNLESNIPQKSGFGSGAAVSTAIARALSKTLGQPFDNETVNRIVFEVEKMHHGTPSGIDNTVIAYECPLYFVKDLPHEFIEIGAPLHLLVAGVKHSTPTKVTVSDVRYLYERHPRRVGRIFNQIGKLACAARQAIESGEVSALGPLMNENHKLLRRLTVSDEVLDRLCQAAMKAGAWGAKLSGGGRGGNIIALIPENRRGPVSDALLQNGAVRVIYTTLDSDI
jgi:mevalonate kinase